VVVHVEGADPRPQLDELHLRGRLEAAPEGQAHEEAQHGAYERGPARGRGRAVVPDREHGDPEGDRQPDDEREQVSLEHRVFLLVAD